MATTTRIDANFNIPADRFKNELQKLTDDADRIMSMAADADLARASKHEAIAARLVKKLGKDDPRVARLGSVAAAHRARGTANSEAFKAIARLPKRNPEDCAVLGQVSDSSGKPARGMRVRLTDKARAVDIGGRVATTDQFGEFSLVYPKCELGAVGGTTPEAFLVVEDSRKQVLFTSPQPVKTTRGRSVHFDIVLAAGLGTAPVKTARRAGKPAEPKTPKAKSDAGAETELEEQQIEAAEPAPRESAGKARKRKAQTKSKPASGEQSEVTKPARRTKAKKPRKPKSGSNDPPA